MSDQEDLARAAQAAWDARRKERMDAWESNGIGFSESFRRAAIETIEELGPRPGGDIVGLLFTAAAQIAFLASVIPLLAPILEPAKKIKAVADKLKSGLDVAGVSVPDLGTLLLKGAQGAGMDKMNAIEGLNIAEAILTTTIAGVRKALADGAITKAEIVSIVISDLQAAYGEATDGDSA